MKLSIKHTAHGHTHEKTDREYVTIAAGLGYPSNNEPGGVVLVGVRPDEERMPIFDVLFEFENTSPQNLFAMADLIYDKHKCECGQLIKFFFADYRQLGQAFENYNTRTRKGDRAWLDFVEPPTLRNPNEKFPGTMYWGAIQALIDPEDKRLFFNNCPIVTRKAQDIQSRGFKGRKAVHDYPPILMALGFVLHSPLDLAEKLPHVKPIDRMIQAAKEGHQNPTIFLHDDDDEVDTWRDPVDAAYDGAKGW